MWRVKKYCELKKIPACFSIFCQSDTAKRARGKKAICTFKHHNLSRLPAPTPQSFIKIDKLFFKKALKGISLQTSVYRAEYGELMGNLLSSLGHLVLVFVQLFIYFGSR